LEYKDPRSLKVVILADYFLNPHRYRKLPNDSVTYETLRDANFGLIKMPPLDTSSKEVEGWLRITGDQIEEYGHRGFKIFLLGVKSLPEGGLWLDGLKKELAPRGVSLPRVVMLSPGQSSTRQDRAALRPALS